MFIIPKQFILFRLFIVLSIMIGISRSFLQGCKGTFSKQIICKSASGFFHSSALRCQDISNIIPPTIPESKPVPPSPPKVSDVGLLEMRVGKIVEIAKHPEADSLYVEKVDVGEATGPRTIVSGLVAFCSEQELLNRKVLVLCNLKPRPLKGITSFGMLLCSSNADHTKVEPLTLNDAVPVGELISIEGHPSAPVEAGNKASKSFSKVADDFFVNDNLLASYKGIPFMTTQGPIHCNLKGKIS